MSMCSTQIDYGPGENCRCLFRTNKKTQFEFKTKLQGRHNGCEGKMKSLFSWDSFLKRNCCLKIIVRNYGFHFSLT